MNFSSNWTILHGTNYETLDIPISQQEKIMPISLQADLDGSKNSGTPKWMVKIMENPINPWMIWGENPLCLETPIWSPEISSTPKRPKRSFPSNAQVASPGSLSDSIPASNEMLELLHRWKIHRGYVSYICVCSAYVLKTDCQKKKLYECTKTVISVFARKFCILVSGLIFFFAIQTHIHIIYSI